MCLSADHDKTKRKALAKLFFIGPAAKGSVVPLDRSEISYVLAAIGGTTLI